MYVTDLNSTNGTMVNGQELSPMDNVAVEVGAEVIFGARAARRSGQPPEVVARCVPAARRKRLPFDRRGAAP